MENNITVPFRIQVPEASDLAPYFGKTRYVHINELRHDEAARLWPSFLRGDVGYGSDAIMREAERRNILYLFKVRHSRVIRALFKSIADDPGWKDCDSG